MLARSGDSADLPIAALIIDGAGSVVSQSRNRVEESGDITAHAEVLALRELQQSYSKLEAAALTLVASLEPCPMCAWAIRSAGIGSVVFGAYNSQYGAAGSVLDLLRDGRYGRRVEVWGGVLERECSVLLAGAFSEMRDNGNW